MSLDRTKTPHEHLVIAKKLQTLRYENILIMASGNIVHNLRMLDWQNNANPFDWAQNFSSQIKKAIL